MKRFALAVFAMTLMYASPLAAQAPAKKPNILVIIDSVMEQLSQPKQ